MSPKHKTLQLSDAEHSVLFDAHKWLWKTQTPAARAAAIGICRVTGARKATQACGRMVTGSHGASRSEAGICRGSPCSGSARLAGQLRSPPRQTGGDTTAAGLAPHPTTTWGLQAVGGATNRMSLASHAHGPIPGSAMRRTLRKSRGPQRSAPDRAHHRTCQRSAALHRADRRP